MKLFTTICFLISSLIGISQSSTKVLSEFVNDAAPAILNGQYGIVNSKGEWLLKPELEKITSFQNNSYLGFTDGKYIVMDFAGKIKNQFKYDSIVYTKWKDEILLYHDVRLSILFKNGELTKPKYDEFQFGWGIDHGLIIDEDGLIKYDAFLNGGKTIEGLTKSIKSSEYRRNCIQSSKNGKVGFMDTNCVEIIPALYDQVKHVSTQKDADGLFDEYYIGIKLYSVNDYEDPRFDIYSSSKKMLVENAISYSNRDEEEMVGNQIIFGKDGKFGIIREGVVIQNENFDQIRYCDEISITKSDAKYSLWKGSEMMFEADSIDWFYTSTYYEDWDEDLDDFVLLESKTIQNIDYFIAKKGDESLLYDVSRDTVISISKEINNSEVTVLVGQVTYNEEDDGFYYEDDNLEERHLFTSFEVLNKLGKLGRVNLSGKHIPVKYDSIFEYESYTLCRINDVIDIYNESYTLMESVQGEVIAAINFFDEYSTYYPIPFIIKFNDKLGLISSEMVVVTPVYDRIESQVTGSFLELVNSSGHFVFKGKLLDYPFKYSPSAYGRDLFSDNRMDFFTILGDKKYPSGVIFEVEKSTKNNKYGLIVLEGGDAINHWAIKPIYDSLVRTSTRFYIGYDTKSITLLNSLGAEQVKINRTAGSIKDWSENYESFPIFLIETKNEKYFYDAAFMTEFPDAEIVEVQYDSEYQMLDLMILRNSKKHYLYDRKIGEKISDEYSEMNFDYVDEFQIIFVKKGSKRGVIDLSGSVIVPIKYSEVWPLGSVPSEAYTVKKKDKTGLYLINGTEVFKPNKCEVSYGFLDNTNLKVYCRQNEKGLYELRDNYGTGIFDGPLIGFLKQGWDASLIIGVDESQMYLESVYDGKKDESPFWKDYQVKAIVGGDVYAVKDDKLYMLQAKSKSITLIKEGEKVVDSEYQSITWSEGQFQIDEWDFDGGQIISKVDYFYSSYYGNAEILYLKDGEWIMGEPLFKSEFMEQWER